jgi:uncharacterized protein YecT (DUF1311 family)
MAVSFVVPTLTTIGPAAAMNCQAAATRQEKAICADPAAQAADEQMAAAFAALRSAMPDADRAAFVADQRQWITARDDRCTYADTSGHRLEGRALSACLKKESDRRRLFLSGMSMDGPGVAGMIRSFFIKGRGRPSDFGLKFGSPRSAGEQAFNHSVDEALKDVNVSDGGKGNTTDDFSMTLNYASPALVSAEIVIAYPSSAHPVDNHSEINVDLAAGRVLKFDDVFRAGARNNLMAQCRQQLDDFIGKAASDELGDADDRDGIMKQREDLVRASAADMTRWSLGSHEMTLTIDDAEQSRITSICRLATGRLKQQLQPSFNLQP